MSGMPSHAGERPGLEAGRWRRLQECFDAGVGLAPEARGAFLQRLEAEEPDLCVELVEMLRAHDTQPLAIEEGLLAPEPAGALIGQRIGPYRVVELIGRGGMGEVYLAEREDQYRQRVALKVVRAGLAVHELRARFRTERQILARLQHASIARLLDGGVTEDGRPYLVMEHVAGVPLTEWCEARRLPVAERLSLFLGVCRAVEFAHRSLIVHRDLKPGNIQVTAAGEVKLLDFGIAKLLDAEAPEGAAPETGTGMGLMTPEHAAPEQVRGEPVTTATDVYALGVLLYELLCGRKPHRLDDRPLAELLRDVLERDPPPPSALAAATLRRKLRGDLDAIAGKALRKEPERRYASAEQLARDLERHLEGRPVMARRGSALYRAGRFLRRNAVPVAASAILALLLLGFSIATLVQSRQVARERDRARAERDTAERVARVLVGLFEASDPTKIPGGDALTVRELLSRSEIVVLRQLDQQPRVQARVRRTLGEMYLARSDIAAAERHLEAALEQHRALGEGEGAEAAAVHHQLALLERRKGADAVPMLRRSLEWQDRLYGAESPQVAAALQDLADSLPPGEPRERERLLSRALELRRRILPTGHPELAENLAALGMHQLDLGRLSEAEKLLAEALSALEAHPDRGPDHPMTLKSLASLAVVHNRQARFDRAQALEDAVLERKARVYGAESPEVAIALNNLGVTLANRGDIPGAAGRFREARRLYSKLLGSGHWETANVTRNLARMLELEGRYGEALPLMSEAHLALRERGDDGGRGELVLRGQLGVLMARTGARGEGLAQLRQANARLQAMFPDGHMHVADTAIALARALLAEPAAPGELEEAERASRRAVEIREGKLGADHPKLAEARCWLGIALAAQGREGEALPLLSEALPIFARWGTADPADLRLARRRLAELQPNPAVR
jgi:serine/threonine-protein kinase